MAEKPPNMPLEAWKEVLYSQGKIERTLAINWLNGVWVRSQRNCPVCTSSNWGVGEDIVRLQTIKGPAYPSIVVVCNTCGYSMLFNAVRMNVLPAGKER
jgi:predicted nucleic-acid-binding Zn-ribbon protein